MRISVANQKGCVAKNTTAVNQTVGLSVAGRKVFLIDMDSQANTTRVSTHSNIEIASKGLFGVAQAVARDLNPHERSETLGQM